MRKETNNRILLMVISLLLLTAIVAGVDAATYTTYRETFETNNMGANPSSGSGEIGYTYAEVGWSANVTTYIDGYKRFYVNQSTTANNGWANFTFNTSDSYDYFGFSFEYLNTWQNYHNHSSIEFRLSGNVGDICYIRVYGANETNVGNRNRLILLDYNSDNIVNVSIAKDTWYTVLIDPDYDSWDDNVQVTITDDGGTDIVDETLDLNGNGKLSKFYMKPVTSSKTCVLIDNLLLVDTTYSNGETTTNYIAGYIFPILYAVAMMVVIMTLMLSGNVDINTMVSVVIITIVGFVALMILTTL